MDKWTVSRPTRYNRKVGMADPCALSYARFDGRQGDVSCVVDGISRGATSLRGNVEGVGGAALGWNEGGGSGLGRVQGTCLTALGHFGWGW